MKEKTWFLLILSISTALPLILFNYFFLREFPLIFQAVNILVAFLIATPIILVRYSYYKRKKEIEQMFVVFLRDFVESVRSGMTITKAFETVSKNDYKSLTPCIKKMVAQLEWGLPLEKVLKNFAKNSGSKLISRIVSSVIESHRFGGNLVDTFEALSNTVIEIDKLRKERSLYLHSQMITGYIVFFVFLGVILALEKFLVPSLSQTFSYKLEEQQPIAPAELVKNYKDLLFHLVLMQSFFAGLAVGKMAEGAIIAGLKHSAIMMTIGGIAYVFLA
jgi:flagellar protein FlaJ